MKIEHRVALEEAIIDLVWEVGKKMGDSAEFFYSDHCRDAQRVCGIAHILLKTDDTKVLQSYATRLTTIGGKFEGEESRYYEALRKLIAKTEAAIAEAEKFKSDSPKIGT